MKDEKLIPTRGIKMSEVKKQFVPYEDTQIKNFSIHENSTSRVRVYNKNCGGCISTKADVMLTFGSTVNVLDGNNKTTDIEITKHIDAFINYEQAKILYEELKDVLKL